MIAFNSLERDTVDAVGDRTESSRSYDDPDARVKYQRSLSTPSPHPVSAMRRKDSPETKRRSQRRSLTESPTRELDWSSSLRSYDKAKDVANRRSASSSPKRGSRSPSPPKTAQKSIVSFCEHLFVFCKPC